MTHNCPFYGRSFYAAPKRTPHSDRPPFLLLNSDSNQCALITTRQTPCYMEINHYPVGWERCPNVRAIHVTTTEEAEP